MTSPGGKVVGGEVTCGGEMVGGESSWRRDNNDWITFVHHNKRCYVQESNSQVSSNYLNKCN